MKAWRPFQLRACECAREKLGVQLLNDSGTQTLKITRNQEAEERKGSVNQRCRHPYGDISLVTTSPNSCRWLETKIQSFLSKNTEGMLSACNKLCRVSVTVTEYER